MLDSKTFDIIDRISREHCNKTFGYLTKDDLKNEIWVICLNLLDNYDYSKGELEHFLRTSVKNRLINKFKEITKSVRSPCPRCPFYNAKGTPDCRKFGEDKYNCDKWKNYHLSVESRNSLLNASEQQTERESDSESLTHIITEEIKLILESNIQEKYKRDLNQLVSSGKLSKQKMKKLKKEIDRILHDQQELVQLKVRGKNAKSK